MTVRNAHREDYHQLAGLYQQVHDLHAENRPDVYKPGATDVFPAERFSKILADDNQALLIAEEEGSILGFVHVTCETLTDYPWSPIAVRATIDAICVDRNHQGQGIGKNLLAAGEKWASAKGADYISLQVRTFNKNAIGVYENNGYAEDALKMGKILKPELGV